MERFLDGTSTRRARESAQCALERLYALYDGLAEICAREGTGKVDVFVLNKMVILTCRMILAHK